MLNIASYNKQIEREEWIKRFGMRLSTLCAVLFIAAVMYLAVQWGYDGTARFTVFCAAAAVYLLCKWVVYPLLRFTASIGRPCKETFHRCRTFSSALGCGNVLFGRFPFFSPSCPSVSYSFISLFYIPLIPTGCYDLSGTGKSLLPIDTEQYSSQSIKWRAVELLYIYAKCWSAALMVLLVAATFFDYVEFLQNQPVIHIVNT